MSGHAGMSPLAAAFIARAEAAERSDEWIYVTLSGEGELVNACGIFRDEVSAMLAAEEDRRDPVNIEHDLLQHYKTIPLFRRRDDAG